MALIITTSILGTFIYLMIGVLIAMCCDFEGRELIGCAAFWPVIAVIAAFKGFISILRSIC